MTFGQEFAGEVTEVGPGVEGIKIGDRVAGYLPLYAVVAIINGQVSNASY